MSDYGHEQTDKELKRIENLITKEYSQAAKELEEKMLKQFEDFNAKDIKMRAKLTAGEITQTEYNNWLYGQVATGDRWRSLRDSMVNTLVNTDKAAATIIQGNSIKAYGDNMNYGTYEIEHDSKINTGFTLYDENTVKNLLKEDPKIIPMPKDPDIPKDELWNRQKLTSAVMQGVLQGESIPQIANRLQSVAFMGRNSAIRNARTYTTAAENKGRLDSYERAEKLGIKTNKKWIATLDERTRMEHRHLDNMSVPYNEPFKVDVYTIEFPGDPNAEPEMFYNCRCTLVADIVGYPYNDERNDDKLGDMTYEEWKHAKDKESKEDIKEEPKEWIKNIDFTPAKTIEDAEQYAKDNFIQKGGVYKLTGKDISYKDIDLDVANRINERLTQIYGNFDINKLYSLESYGQSNKKVWDKNSDAIAVTTNFGNIGLNKTIIGNAKIYEKYLEKGEKDFQFVLENIDKLSGASRELAEVYRIAGKTLVGDSIEDAVTHEIGHHLSYMVETNKEFTNISKNTNWREYAQHISGYANKTFGEYIAESFDAYYRNELDGLQPEMIEVFNGLRR